MPFAVTVRPRFVPATPVATTLRVVVSEAHTMAQPRAVHYVLFAVLMMACAPEPATLRPHTAEEAAVLATVERFFTTMTAQDTAGARAVLDPDGDFVSVRWTADGERVVRRMSNRDYLAELAVGGERYVERMWDPEVRIRGPIAVVWTPYDFHIDGRFSHCGVDVFQLLETDTGWVITGGTYTVERTGCREHPAGAPTGAAIAAFQRAEAEGADAVPPSAASSDGPNLGAWRRYLRGTG